MQWRKYKNTLVVLGVIIAVAFTGICLSSSITVAKEKEIGPNAVKGKVVSIETNVFRKGVIVVKSDQSGENYTFYVGNRTEYYPRRYPSIGETIKVHYINDRGYLKATRVEIITNIP
jgi:hypothetical protein